jgi:outer membrane protein assembly factor BamA
MPANAILVALLVSIAFLTSLHADCTGNNDQRTSEHSGILISDWQITGTRTLTSTELAEITGKLIGFCFDEATEDLQERVRGAFLNRGFFHVEVENFQIKPLDPLGVPKPVILETQISEGPHFKLAKVKFAGNRVFDASTIRKEFSMKPGELFERDKIGHGLEGIRRLYVSRGYMDFTCLIDTDEPSDHTVSLDIPISEGQQYHMGKLDIFARKELADRLTAAWEIREGAVFDFSYLEQYIDANRSLLPSGFNEQGVQLVRNCRDATVEVRLPLDGTDPRSQAQPQDIDCKSAKEVIEILKKINPHPAD